MFFCNECGYSSAKWLGKCPSCNSWNSFVEENVTKVNNTKINNNKAVILDDVAITDKTRISSGFNELDRVFRWWNC
ncbi:MAG: hypothetical protein RSF67_01950 [Clostridia bacterium]